MNQVNLDQSKIEIEDLIKSLDTIMQEIQKLDTYINDSEDPDAAATMVDIIMKKAEKFEFIVEKIRIKLSVYIQKQQELNLPVDFSYVKLLQQILKG